MFSNLFLTGLLIGFSIAMPVGPIGLLCIRNVLTFGVACGILTGLGAACADTIYGAVAGFGITAISGFLESHSLYLRIVGAIFLCYLGATTFFAKPASTGSSTNETRLTLKRAFLTTFLLTLTNPLTILSFAAIYAGLGIGNDSLSINGALTITFGVFLGSAAWWFILSFISSLFKGKMNVTSSIWLNRFSGSLIFGFGAFAFLL